MRRRNLTNGYERDPLLKVGTGAMIVALGFALVVAVAASLERPMQVAAAKSEKMSSTTRPLVRSDPGVVPWVERDIPPPKPKVVTEPAGDLQPASVPKPDKRPVPSGPRPEQQTGTLPREDRVTPSRQKDRSTRHTTAATTSRPAPSCPSPSPP